MALQVRHDINTLCCSVSAQHNKGIGVTYCKAVDQLIWVCTNASTMNRLWLFFFFSFPVIVACFTQLTVYHIYCTLLWTIFQNILQISLNPVYQADVVYLTVLKSTQMFFRLHHSERLFKASKFCNLSLNLQGFPRTQHRERADKHSVYLVACCLTKVRWQMLNFWP